MALFLVFRTTSHRDEIKKFFGLKPFYGICCEDFLWGSATSVQIKIDDSEEARYSSAKTI